MLVKFFKFLSVSFIIQSFELMAQTSSSGLSVPITLPEIGTKELRSVSTADLNGDKLLDLIMGNYSGEIIISLNEGTAQKPKFIKEEKLKSKNKPIKIKHW